MFLDPFKSNIYFDSCAFDGGSQEEQTSSIECRQILEQSGNKIQILHSVQKEIDYPKTPSWVKREAMSSVFTKETGLEADELIKLRGPGGRYVASLVMLWVLDILPFQYQKYIFFAYNSSTYYIL